MTTAAVRVEPCPLSARIGAQVSGVRLGSDLAPETVEHIRQAVLFYKVVFFRGQDCLHDRSQHGFASLFGTPTRQHPIGPAGNDIGGMFVFDSRYVRANVWHTDSSYVADYPGFSILRAVTVPKYGGDTVWANTAAAYACLPTKLAALADGLWAVHNNLYGYGATTQGRASAAERKFHRTYETVHFETEHPVVRVHPETGERCLVLGEFAHAFVDIPQEYGVLLRELFHRSITLPENTVRWHWEPGDVAIWDNRATQHIALDDYGDVPRRLHRVTVDGEVPVSVHGRPSVIRIGADASWYRRNEG